MTFQQFMARCDHVTESTLGLTTRDMPDATWRDYYDDEMTPTEAVAAAAEDWWDVPAELLEALI